MKNTFLKNTFSTSTINPNLGGFYFPIQGYNFITEIIIGNRITVPKYVVEHLEIKEKDNVEVFIRKLKRESEK